MPQRMASRASRFFCLRLLYDSESESLAFPPCPKIRSFFGPRDRKCALRLEAVTIVRERRGEVALMDKIKDSERR
jgi:hypothetical protein